MGLYTRYENKLTEEVLDQSKDKKGNYDKTKIYRRSPKTFFKVFSDSRLKLLLLDGNIIILSNSIRFSISLTELNNLAKKLSANDHSAKNSDVDGLQTILNNIQDDQKKEKATNKEGDK